MQFNKVTRHEVNCELLSHIHFSSMTSPPDVLSTISWWNSTFSVEPIYYQTNPLQEVLSACAAPSVSGVRSIKTDANTQHLSIIRTSCPKTYYICILSIHLSIYLSIYIRAVSVNALVYVINLAAINALKYFTAINATLFTSGVRWSFCTPLSVKGGRVGGRVGGRGAERTLHTKPSPWFVNPFVCQHFAK